ncbi:NUDIX domain-containing protein [Actinoplanes teichomyceticus]|uniref:NUDIX domain-containing protein n=1 Tax=Actinoplanes teichomyceticus TaxID=1867 RepID=UPI001944CF59|nr:NUDIX domain-containing protein [Actinoplanes teichomyceticus]GIF13549.1 hypothetical protein Ate01nite_35810 [Actinoplanes teichomyceticus]
MFEETGVRVRVERLLSVEALELSVVSNGDQVHWLAIGLRCRLVEGDARVNDDESVEVGWFDPDVVPSLPAHQARCRHWRWPRTPTRGSGDPSRPAAPAGCRFRRGGYVGTAGLLRLAAATSPLPAVGGPLPVDHAE